MTLKREITELFNALLSRESNSLKSRLAKGALGTFILKIISVSISFFSAFLLARILKAEGYGIYSYVISLVGILGIPTLMGFDRLLIRDVSAYSVSSEWGLIRGLLRWTNITAVIISGVIILISIMVIHLFYHRFNPDIINPLIVGLFLLPFLSMMRLRQTTLQGLERVVEGQLPEMLIQPCLFILLVSIIYLLMNTVDVTLVIVINLISTAVAFLIGVYLLRKNLPLPVKNAIPVYKKDEWLRVALPLLFLSGIQVFNDRIDTVLLSVLRNTYEVGIFTVALRGAELITFPLIAVNTAIAPTVSRLYVSGDMMRLQRLITRSTRLMLLFSLPVALVFIIFGKWFLLIFGQEFTEGASALAIMSAGQIFNVSMGSVGLLLIMTGHERYAVMGTLIAVLLKIILSIILVPILGVDGSALARSSGIVTWNTLLAVWVYKKIGIHSTVFGRIF